VRGERGEGRQNNLCPERQKPSHRHWCYEYANYKFSSFGVVWGTLNPEDPEIQGAGAMTPINEVNGSRQPCHYYGSLGLLVSCNQCYAFNLKFLCHTTSL